MYVLSQFYQNVCTTSNLTPRTFGCLAFVHVSNHNKGKRDPRVVKCVCIGYSPTKHDYNYYHSPTSKFHAFIDVTFNEGQSFFSKHLSSRGVYFSWGKLGRTTTLYRLAPLLLPTNFTTEISLPRRYTHLPDETLDTMKYVQMYLRRKNPKLENAPSTHNILWLKLCLFIGFPHPIRVSSLTCILSQSQVPCLRHCPMRNEEKLWELRW